MERSGDHNFEKRRGFIFLLIILMFCILSGVLMLLWNEVLPDITGVKTISYWQAWCILGLCRILFGSFSFGGKGRRPPFTRSNQREDGTAMTDEERQQFKAELKKRTQ